MENTNNTERMNVTLNVADMTPVSTGNPFFGGHEHPVYDFLCEVIVNGTVKGTFDAELPADASLNTVVAEKYGEEEFEAEGKSAFDFDEQYIKDAMYDYMENSEDLAESYGEEIIKAFNKYMEGELVATEVTCKPISEFGFMIYGRK